MLNTPVLFLVFNRPDFTEQVFAQIKQAQPKQLFIAADGPREDKPEDIELCSKTKAVILDNINWPCEVKTLLREENLGCGVAPAEAITWFFNKVEQGIILEDDCLPALSFFKFCEELLELYKTDERVVAISGTNLLEKYQTDAAYFFSVYGGNWGWASWRRAWMKFDYTNAAWKLENCKKSIKDFIGHDDLFSYLSKIFDNDAYSIKNDVWDYQWFLCRLANKGLSIVPAYNLIQNIGFGENATHTFDANNKVSKLKTTNVNFPLTHVKKITPESNYDGGVFDNYLRSTPSGKLNIKRSVLKFLKMSNFQE